MSNKEVKHNVSKLVQQHGSLRNYLEYLFHTIIREMGCKQNSINIDFSSRPSISQFQFNGIIKIAKERKKSPFEIANLMVEKLKDNGNFEKIEFNRPVFINIILKQNFVNCWLYEMYKDEDCGYNKKTKERRKVIFDFGGANIAKPLHIGHIRSPIIGDCLKKIYKFHGHKVISDVHLGDWGTQIGMVIEGIKRIYPKLPYFKNDFSGDYPDISPVNLAQLSHIYPKESERCKTNKNCLENARNTTAELQKGHKGYLSLWKNIVNLSKSAIKNDYDSLNVKFDLWKGESSVNSIANTIIQNAVKNKIAEYDKGTIIIKNLKKENGEILPPLILRKSNNALTYGVTDIATIADRITNDDVSKIVYVVDKRQSLHFEQVFSAAKKLNIINNTKLIYIGFGTVNNKNNQPFKTREGNTVKLNEFIQNQKELKKLKRKNTNQNDKILHKMTLATIKFADLSNIRTANYIFDWKKFSKDEGKTGTYVIYSAIRIKSILKKIQRNDKIVKIKEKSTLIETDIQLKLTDLPYIISKAYRKNEPHHLCNYIYKICSLFNIMYSRVPIINENNEKTKNARISLCLMTLKCIELVLKMLGIQIPKEI